MNIRDHFFVKHFTHHMSRLCKINKETEKKKKESEAFTETLRKQHMWKNITTSVCESSGFSLFSTLSVIFTYSTSLLTFHIRYIYSAQTHMHISACAVCVQTAVTAGILEWWCQRRMEAGHHTVMSGSGFIMLPGDDLGNWTHHRVQKTLLHLWSMN